MNVNNPVNTVPIVDKNGNMTANFRTWTLLISRESIILGVGSPEGVIEAQQTREYMDESGAPGAIKYIKQLSNIGGDKTLGWVAIG